MSNHSFQAWQVQEQQQHLSSKMQRSLEFLQATGLELRVLVTQECERNPTLVPDGETEDVDEAIETVEELVERIEQESQPASGESCSATAADDDSEPVERIQEHYISQWESTLSQLDFLDDKNKIIASWIIGMTGENGRFYGMITEVAARFNVTVDYVRQLMALIAQHVIPVPESVTEIVSPDLVIDEAGELELNQDEIPRPQISRFYTEMFKCTHDETVREYLRAKLQASGEIIQFIENRGTTIQRVAEVIFAHQWDFLAGGITQLEPLKMAEVASVVKLHEATISRAVSGKFVQTPWGLHPLKRFFVGGLVSGKRGDEMTSTDSVKAMIRDIVAKHPQISDQQVSNMLVESGVVIARRTVNKYRNQK